MEKIDEDKAIKDAAILARSCDVAVVFGGLTPEWEAEGFDRPDLLLPRRQPGRHQAFCRRYLEQSSSDAACRV